MTLQSVVEEIVLRPIGFIRSPFAEREQAPRQGSEAAAEGELVVDEAYSDAFLGLKPGQKIVILYWMHLAERDVLQVHPRHDLSRPLRGVFSTRSPDRPNPISLDTVEIVRIVGTTLHVTGIDALDGTPLLDIKCVS
ncbi:MAG: tRNA (N6-threonylcarbamoyladenosine(37)-N6)-methyltransferase TrmO [Desulfobacteraceae bacterium]|nr:tRNA (N6-threonylcarbamoyladenosine(37)-N6)-methyltransferase TrmO [Desulfobacteraceae bacterium]